MQYFFTIVKPSQSGTAGNTLEAYKILKLALQTVARFLNVELYFLVGEAIVFQFRRIGLYSFPSLSIQNHLLEIVRGRGTATICINPSPRSVIWCAMVLAFLCSAKLSHMGTNITPSARVA